MTSHDDRETQRLCRELSVECRPTDLLEKGGLVQRDGDKVFAKGRAIDWGLGYLERSRLGLPPRRGHLPPAADARGSSRPPAPTRSASTASTASTASATRRGGNTSADPAGLHPLRHHCLLVPPPFPLGARLVLPEHEGYVPIGFFQLWHGSHGRRYPLRQGSAEHTDVLHALQWPRDKRRLLAEVVAVHLESEPSRMGANWSGRTTAPFGPEGWPARTTADACADASAAARRCPPGTR